MTLSCGSSSLSAVSLQLHLSHQRVSKHPNSFLFDLFSIDEELTIVTLQKSKNRTISIDEELVVDLSSSLFNWQESQDIRASQFLDARENLLWDLLNVLYIVLVFLKLFFYL